mgnify:CR=1 FL=1
MRAGAIDKTAKLWDIEAGALVYTFEGHSDWVVAVALSAQASGVIRLTVYDYSRGDTTDKDAARSAGARFRAALRGSPDGERVLVLERRLHALERGVTAETAEARLNTILAATELGAGFQIAMRDLEIRGMGNILGAEQSGHIAAVMVNTP